MEGSIYRIIKIIVPVVTVLVIGCMETSFSGSGSSKPPPHQDRKANQGNDKDSDIIKNTNGDKRDRRPGLDADSNNATNADDLDVESANKIDDCLKAKADDYNILMIFDNSGSQEATDPENIRREGAISFVDQFAEYARRNPNAVVRFGVLSFNEDSVRIGDSWLKVQNNQILPIKQQIIQATTNPAGGTAYSPVLRDATTFFGALSDEDRKVKNYVVFLTDGLPNAAGIDSLVGITNAAGPDDAVEKMADIPIAVDNLVKQYNVAVIAIAAGPGIPAAGEHITRSLAQPKQGINAPDHIGMYFRATTPHDLKDVWESLMTSIGSCTEPSNP